MSNSPISRIYIILSPHPNTNHPTLTPEMQCGHMTCIISQGLAEGHTPFISNVIHCQWRGGEVLGGKVETLDKHVCCKCSFFLISLVSITTLHGCLRDLSAHRGALEARCKRKEEHYARPGDHIIPFVGTGGGEAHHTHTHSY